MIRSLFSRDKGSRKFGLVQSEERPTWGTKTAHSARSVTIDVVDRGWDSGLGKFPDDVPPQISSIVSPDEWKEVIHSLNRSLSKVPAPSVYIHRMVYGGIVLLVLVLILPVWTTGYVVLSCCLLYSLLVTLIVVIKLVQVKMELSWYCNDYTAKFWSRGLVFSYNISICETPQSWVLIIDILNSHDEPGKGIGGSRQSVELSEMEPKEMFI
mmetsp:Transcript_5445/g.8709  ORF Transcript_5445/g.8709 Transcript_5445/m.8709 type:complete len:211 (+) Transcript_5445:33-665(+)|eukprot:CAMPEP_0206383034 /NCGR_PEP_ID=MMETSP0294-20121207/13663_1 /ASSEMBLY_ACC=CAM_ASM_000327 /TAXON_ID=39354 /ORGANISM="Heterosigma akashiwo, Strain CCMP2393" /LENGTH=210 /DNA_ID=CAMNT_0053832925 /DNA_START=33 /DNA_END=665 /DNA_ORIENTATION=+